MHQLKVGFINQNIKNSAVGDNDGNVNLVV